MQINIDKLLFFDIETVSQHEKLSELSEDKLSIWHSYYSTFLKRVTDESKLPKMPSSDVQMSDTNSLDSYIENLHQEVYRQTAAFFPEFGKVACVSLAFVTKQGETKFESFYGDNEIEILEETRKVFNKIDGLGFELCGQNIKNFDIPFLGKRFVINGLKPPTIFPTHDTKPWELKVLDTKELWNFGSRNGLSSLDLICSSLNVDSPKNGNVRGDSVNHNFWLGNHEDIKEYCEKDVQALIDIIMNFKNLR